MNHRRGEVAVENIHKGFDAVVGEYLAVVAAVVVVAAAVVVDAVVISRTVVPAAGVTTAVVAAVALAVDDVLPHHLRRGIP